MKIRGVFKRGNIYYIRYADPTGKIIRESARTRNLNDAIRLLAKRKAEIEEGKYPQRIIIKNHTFSELADRYLKYAFGEAAYETKFYIVRKLKERFGKLLLRSFTPFHIEALQTEMLKNGYKIASINKVTSILKHMFQKAVDWDMVEIDVLQRLRRAKNLKGENKRVRYLNKDEALRLINCADPFLKPIIQIALLTGMRKGEILSLRWSNIDLKNGFIFVARSKNNEVRQIPMCNTLKAIMKELFLKRRLDTDLIFYNPSNPSKRVSDIRWRFNAACKLQLLWSFCCYCLFHCFPEFFS